MASSETESKEFATRIDFSSAINADEYDKGGIIDTINLKELPKDFKSPFVNDPIQSDKTIKKVLIIYNPVSGGGLGKQLVKEYIFPKLESCNIKSNALVSEGPKFITKYLIQQKEQLLSLKIDAFFVVGGDGTYHEFVNGYIAGEYLKENIPVLFLCGGTGNSLSLHLGISGEVELKKLVDKLCTHIQMKKSININYMDCIQLNTLKSMEEVEDAKNDEDDDDDARHIIYGCSQTYWGIPASCGKTAESLRFFGGYRYDIAALYQIIRKDARKIKLTLYFDDQESKKMEIDIDISVLVIMKNKYFGKGLMITPFAKLDNGYLDVAILPNSSRKQTLSLFSLVPKGTHILNTSQNDGPYYFRVKKVCLEPYDGCHDEIGIDGEFGPKTPFTIKVLPQAIPIISV